MNFKETVRPLKQRYKRLYGWIFEQLFLASGVKLFHDVCSTVEATVCAASSSTYSRGEQRDMTTGLKYSCIFSIQGAALNLVLDEMRLKAEQAVLHRERAGG